MYISVLLHLNSIDATHKSNVKRSREILFTHQNEIENDQNSDLDSEYNIVATE